MCFSLRAKADNPPEGTIEAHNPPQLRSSRQSIDRVLPSRQSIDRVINYSFQTPTPGGCQFLCCRKYLAQACNYLKAIT
jgi:hypothetical protein